MHILELLEELWALELYIIQPEKQGTWHGMVYGIKIYIVWLGKENSHQVFIPAKPVGCGVLE